MQNGLLCQFDSCIEVARDMARKAYPIGLSDSMSSLWAKNKQRFISSPFCCLKNGILAVILKAMHTAMGAPFFKHNLQEGA